jgi:hypothetical protein
MLRHSLAFSVYAADGIELNSTDMLFLASCMVSIIFASVNPTQTRITVHSTDVLRLAISPCLLIYVLPLLLLFRAVSTSAVSDVCARKIPAPTQ